MICTQVNAEHSVEIEALPIASAAQPNAYQVSILPKTA